MEDRVIGEVDDEAYGDTIASVTHARLRAEQGDTTGARAVLRSVLQDNPSDAEAVQMLASITGLRNSRHDEPVDPALREAHPAEAINLVGSFRATLAGAPAATVVARLRRLQRMIERNRGARRNAR